MTLESFTKENSEIIQLKEGTYMFFDHIIRNGGKMIYNNGTWDTRQTRITFDDMQAWCAFHNKDCRHGDIGKGIVTALLPHQKPLLLCKFHYVTCIAFTRFTPQGDEILEYGRSWHP